MRMVQLASSRSTTTGVRFLRRTQRRVVPLELTRMCPASPRRVGWVTAGKGQRRASSGADDGVTTRTKTFVLLPFDSFCRRKQSCKDLLSCPSRSPPSRNVNRSFRSAASSVLLYSCSSIHTRHSSHQFLYVSALSPHYSCFFLSYRV